MPSGLLTAGVHPPEDGEGLSSAPKEEGLQQLCLCSLESSEGHDYCLQISDGLSHKGEVCGWFCIPHRAEVRSLGMQVNGRRISTQSKNFPTLMTHNRMV